ncbi:MAG: GC-type dockerin domain-anchored protein [Phycisphaerales bacterium]
MRAITAVLTVGSALSACAGSAWAQLSDTVLRLEAGSTFEQEYCLGPCTCPGRIERGALAGTYRLSFVTIGNVFDLYEISDISWVARIGQESRVITGSGLYFYSDIANLHRIELDLLVGDDQTPWRVESDSDPLGNVRLPSINIGCDSGVVICSEVRLQIRSSPICRADFNHDGSVDGDDTIAYFAAWEANDPAADFNADGGVDGDDVIAFFGRWDGGC